MDRLAARAGTPKAIGDKIEVATKVIGQAAEKRLAGLVAATVGTGAAEFAAYVAAERANRGKWITDPKLRLE